MKILIVLWLVFFTSHSLLAATEIKAFFEKNLRLSPPQYRLMYNAIAILLLISIVFQLLKTPSELIFDKSNFVFGIGCGFVLASLWILKSVFKDISLSAFLGFTATSESFGLITTGFYTLVRHPLYFGSTVLLIGLLLMIPTWTVAVSVGFSIVYIIVGIEFEERKLHLMFGSVYDDYTQGKKKFLPFLY